MFDHLTLKYLPSTETFYTGLLENLKRDAQQGHPVAYIQTLNKSDSMMPLLNDPAMTQSHMDSAPRLVLPEVNVKEILDELGTMYPGETNSEIVRNVISGITRVKLKKNPELGTPQKHLYAILYYQSALFLSRFPTYSKNHSFLHSMFVTKNLPELHSRISPQIAFKMLGPFDGYNSADYSTTDYDLTSATVQLDLQEYVLRTPFLFDDYFIAIINLDPYMEDQIAHAVAKKHNQSSFEALKEIKTEKCLDVEESEKNNSHDSNNSIIDEIAKIVVSYRTDDSTITHIAMGVKLFRYLTKIETPNLVNASHSLVGLHTFPGIPHITAVVDPLLDTEDDGCMMYAVDRMNAIYGQGPIILHSYYDNHRNTFLGGFFEFFQYKIINIDDLSIPDKPKKEFAFKIKVSLPTSV